MKEKRNWFNVVFDALYDLGGKAHISQIEDKVKSSSGESISNFPESWKRIVNSTLCEYSSVSKKYRKGNLDIFYPVYGLRKGWWGIRPEYPLKKYVDIVVNSGDKREIEKLYKNLKELYECKY